MFFDVLAVHKGLGMYASRDRSFSEKNATDISGMML